MAPRHPAPALRPIAAARSTAALAAAVVLLTAAAPAQAQGDLDLISHSSVAPNVVLVLDNSGSMRNDVDGVDRIEVAGDTLVDLVNAVNPSDGAGGREETVRFGLARFPIGESGNNASLPGSSYWNGCVGATMVEPVASGNDDDVIASVQQIVTYVQDSIVADGTCLSETLLDIGRYLGGGEGFPSYPSDLTADRTLPVWVEPNPRERETKAIEPICAAACPSPMDLACRQNFVIFITDGEPVVDEHDHYGSPDAGGSSAYTTFLADVGNDDGDQNECDPNTADPADCTDDPNDGRDDGITYPSMGTDWMDDVAHYLNRTDFAPGLDGKQNVVTYTVGFAVDHPLLNEAAINGGGEYYTTNDAAGLASNLQAAVQDIIAATQASFTSAVVPSSQTGFGSSFYNTFFESSSEPVWEGHLEAYRLAPNGEIQDSDLDPAVDPATGELLATRQPFWDAGERLASQASRTLYTTLFGNRELFEDGNLLLTELALDVLNPAEIPAYPNYPDSGVLTSTQLRTALIRYIHGRDGFDEDGDSSATDLRPVVLGDIFHSTPLVVAPPRTLFVAEPGYVDFRNTYKERDRVIYAGANDGVFHAFDAGSFHSGDDGSTPEIENGYYDAGTGDERFGYVPGLLLGKVKMVPRNSPRSEYFVDGSPVAADAWLGNGSGTDTSKTADEWATVLITGFREGGSGYLALDVTDPGAGAADPHGPWPKLLWEFSHSKLGQSWSEPVITRVKLRAGAGVGDHCGPDDGDGDCLEVWVAIFAGGYAADADPNRSAYLAPGDLGFRHVAKGIFMVRLDNGELLSSVEYAASPDNNGNLLDDDGDGTFDEDHAANTSSDMVYAMPSSPAVLDLDFDGFADLVYVGDLGGQVFKWDLTAVGEDLAGDDRIDSWPAGVFFRTPKESMGGGVDHFRSFFFPPAATFLRGKLLLAFGSGERHDLTYAGDAARAENNRFYVVRDDHPIGALALSGTLDESDLTDVTGLDLDTDPSDKGYFFQVADGEKFVTDVTIFAGYALAASYSPIPSADVCATAGGQGFLYAVRVASGVGFFPDPGAPPSEDRRMAIGGGLPSRPRVSVGRDPEDDVVWIKTSDNRVMSIGDLGRDDKRASMIYWRQRF